MPSIEYSPSNLAHCQKCRRRISKGQVRVSTLAQSSYGGRGEYTKQYTHAECYTGRKDFTKFYGFCNLYPEDTKRFLTEKQLREAYPQDYVKPPARPAVTYGEGAAAVPSATANEFDDDDDELANFDLDAAISSQPNVVSRGENSGPVPNPTASKPSSAPRESQTKKKHGANVGNVGANQKRGNASRFSAPVTIVMIGLKSADARAVPGERLDVIPDPTNRYNPNAMKVVNSHNQRVGYLQGKLVNDLAEKGVPFKKMWAKAGKKMIMIATPVDVGDGSKQTIHVQGTFVDIVAKTNRGNGKEVAAPADIARGDTQKSKAITVDIVTRSDQDDKKIAAAPAAIDARKDTQKQNVMTVVGLNYAQVRARSGERVTLIREPDNKYDRNAVKVVSSSGQKIGHLKATEAAEMSKAWDSLNRNLEPKGERMEATGTIIDDGDGYTQPVQVKYKHVTPTKSNNEEKVVVAFSSTAGVSTPKGKRTAEAVPVTISSKKARR